MSICLINSCGEPCKGVCEDCDIIGEFDNTKIYKKLYTDGVADVCCTIIKKHIKVNMDESYEAALDTAKCDKCIYKRLC